MPRTRGVACLALSLLALLMAACGPEVRLDGSVDGPAPEAHEHLMAGTPHETPLYVLEGRGPGRTVLVLAGVHGDEPGSWLAAEYLVRSGAPDRGRLVVVPRANRIAVETGVRSTPELGDLNRLYGSPPEVLPMAAMAAEIVEVVRRYEIDVVIDLHESWRPFEPHADGALDTAAIGQTVSAHPREEGGALARAVVQRANRSLASGAPFTYIEFPSDYEEKTIVPLPDSVSFDEITNLSAFHIADLQPGVVTILVEVSQQQSLQRRAIDQLLIIDALLREL